MSLPDDFISSIKNRKLAVEYNVKLNETTKKLRAQFRKNKKKMREQLQQEIATYEEHDELVNMIIFPFIQHTSLTSLGYKLVSKTDESALLSAEGSDDGGYLIHLSKVGKEHRLIEGEQSAVRRAGLFHFAILLPSRKYLANMFKHLTKNPNQLCFEGAADHLVSESLYLRDPDSNGVEIYRDRDRSEWVREGPFQIKMSTEHLDLERLYSEADSTGQWSIPDKTVIGHVHLHVSNLHASKIFYSENLGLHHTCTYPGVFFFAADSYHHHVATNTWLGSNIRKADPEQPGLEHFALKVGSRIDFESLLQQLHTMNIEMTSDSNDKISNDSIFVHDPDRIKMQIYY